MLTWGRWLSPRAFRELPVHQWYVFPHSFSPDLVDALAGEWGLSESDHLLDPFVGSGTTPLAAQGLGIPSTGYDLSPLARLVSRAKADRPSRSEVEGAQRRLVAGMGNVAGRRRPRRSDPMLLRAFGEERLRRLVGIADLISSGGYSDPTKDFLRVALLQILPQFALAVRSGGWLRWRDHAEAPEQIERVFRAQVETMAKDLTDDEKPRVAPKIELADARKLPNADDSITAVLTSPPYPNRHDYTRVFLLELLLLFLDAAETKRLRRQSFESHPEAAPRRPVVDRYSEPAKLATLLEQLRSNRIRRMIRGYFLDLHLCLREVARVLRPGAPAALVVGNAQYEGRSVFVDDLTAEIGEGVGLRCTEIRVARVRGNSAQQMGRYGRRPSRESVVLFVAR